MNFQTDLFAWPEILKQKKVLSENQKFTSEV